MTLIELNLVIKDLKDFIKGEERRLKSIHGIISAIKVMSAVVKNVVTKIDSLKKVFDMTNKEAQTLAVSALSPQIDKIFKAYLGGFGKLVYKIAPKSFKKSIAKFLVDTAVSIIHSIEKKIKKAKIKARTKARKVK